MSGEPSTFVRLRVACRRQCDRLSGVRNRICGFICPDRDACYPDPLDHERGDSELLHSRRSVRGFRNEAVPKAVIREIIEDAKRAPSSMNSQPWHVHVLTDAPLEQVRRRNREEMAAGKPSKRDIFANGPYEAVHRTRQVDIAEQLFAAMGIARDDAAMRQDSVLRGFRQFDAPVSLVLTHDRGGPHPGSPLGPGRPERRAEPTRGWRRRSPSPRGIPPCRTCPTRVRCRTACSRRTGRCARSARR